MSSQKSVLITGCSTGGIGNALAKSFQKRGFLVFATARSLDKMSELKVLPGVILIQLDVTSDTSIASAVLAVRAGSKKGKLDYLVNNAGCNYYSPALDADISTARKMFDVNFWGALATIQAFSPLLFEAQGTVVNLGSIVGYLYTPWSSIYNASKAAINIFSESLRLELQPLGIKVVTVITGSVASNIMANNPEIKLPSSSKYFPIKKELSELAKGNDGIKRMTCENTAEGIVTDILKGDTGLIWRGSSATLVKWGSSFLPRWYIDRILSDAGKIGKMPPVRPEGLN